MSGLWTCCLLALICGGCATTGGREWLTSPVDQRGDAQATSYEGAETTSDARPRLNHTVTLGETYAATAAAAPAAPGAAPTVQVNVHTQVPVYINNYGGYGYGYGGYGYGAPRSAPVHATSSSSKVGADFPAPPDYGPRALR